MYVIYVLVYICELVGEKALVGIYVRPDVDNRCLSH